MIVAGQDLAGAVSQTSNSLATIQQGLDQSVVQNVQQVNTLSSQVANLNQQIEQVSNSGDNPGSLEDQRDAHSPLRVLHDAVRLAGISDTGPMQPYLSNFSEPDILAGIEKAAKELLAAERAAMAKAA